MYVSNHCEPDRDRAVRIGKGADAAITVRSGMPLRGGRLVRAARERGDPVLFSANAFARTYPPGHERAGMFRRFAKPDVKQLDGMDAALDSAGYVAAAYYGEYRWTVEEYVDDLAAAYPWRWWAAMDFCCEPEIAGDPALRVLRIAATADKLAECRRAAARRGISAPMPVVQGWTPREYLMCIDWLPLLEWPPLIGIGSMCRRPLHGPNGIIEILDALDQALPAHVRCHLFGVKSQALAALAHHPRVHSVDSMAWDVRARTLRRTGRDMTFRIQCMADWLAQQQRQLHTHSRGAGVQRSLLDPADFGGFTSMEESAVLAVALEWAALLAGGEDTYTSAVARCRRDAACAIGVLRQRGTTRRAFAMLDDTLGGVGDRLERLLANDPTALQL